MKNSKKTWNGLFCGVGLILGLAAGMLNCGTADELFDCQSVCSRYKDCFNSNYDVGACRSRCKDNADKDRTYRDKADACQKCIDDRSCTDATFKCTTECATIVP